MNYIRRLLRVLLVTGIALSSCALIVSAEEDHYHWWTENGQGTEEISPTQHKTTFYFVCIDCGETSTQTEIEDHDWEEITNEYDYEYKEISGSQHAYTVTYECLSCGAQKTETIKENHDWAELPDSKYEYKKISGTQHEYTVDTHECMVCDAIKTITVKENHNWDSGDAVATKISSSQHRIKTTYSCYDCGATKDVTKKGKHKWLNADKDEYKTISQSQHSHKIHYWCEICEAEKTKIKKEKHNWIYSTTDSIKDVSSKNHICVNIYYCDACETEKTGKVTEKHTYDKKYGICYECDHVKPRSEKLQSGKWAYLNNKTWAKVTAPKNGYLIVEIKNASRKLNPYYSSPITYALSPWSFYDVSKRIYPKYKKISGSSIIPVKKGVYYIKTDDNPLDIKFTFKKDSSAKNYSRKKAMQLGKNRKATALIYSNGKKNTWNRYYKIKVPKKQFLHISIESGLAGSMKHVQVYTKGGKQVKMTTDYDKKGNKCGILSNKKITKGTYYIVISENWSPANKKQTTGSYYAIKWS